MSTAAGFVVAGPVASAIMIVGVVRSEARIARVALGGSIVAAAFAIALEFDASARLAATIALGIAGIAIVVTAFAARSMSLGSVEYSRFFALLSSATAGSLAIATATDLRVLAAAWIVTGWCTSALLAQGTPAAMPWSRRHRVIEAVGTAGWAVALVLAWRGTHNFDLTAFAHVMVPEPETTALALVIVVIGATRSAIVPFHRWLPNSMESPTAVSAFMHAGIVNGAGILMVKTAWIISAAPGALLLAALAGAATAFTGAAIALVRPEVKRRLGWSTVAQMGFMVLQCGCGAFAGAIVHLIAHGGYKSAAFLGAAGSIDALKADRRAPAASPSHASPIVAAGLALVSGSCGVALAWSVTHDALVALPAATVTIAIAWSAGTIAARRANAVAVDPLGRTLIFAGIAAVVSIYLLAVVGVERWIGGSLPSVTFAPAAATVTTVILCATLADVFGFTRRPRDPAYTLALVEGRPVAFVSTQ